MKNLKNCQRGTTLLVAICLLVISACSVPADKSALAPSDLPKGKNWKLVWSDEFNGTELDRSIWGFHWLEKRKGGYWGEEAAYLDGKGNLVLKVYEKEGKYYSAGIETRGNIEHKYGYWEVRGKLPEEQGHWPAFWINTPRYGQKDDPAVGGAEIDVMEYPTRTDETEHNIHWGKVRPDYRLPSTRGKKSIIPGLAEGYHTFGVEWTTEEYIFYIDGKETWRINEGISHIEQYIIISEEVGDWGGDITKAKLPDYFIVDYVRVYDLDK